MDALMKDKRLVKGLLGVGLAYGLLLATPGASALSFESVLQWIQTMQRESSAWAVATKQTSLGAYQQTMAKARSQQQLATAIGTLTMSKRIGDAVVAVDGTLGQPVSIKCEAQMEGELQVASWDQINNDRKHLMATFASSRVSDAGAVDRERLAVHRDSYCTVSEARSELCTLAPNGMQGWDSNYAGAFGMKTLPAEGELAGLAYAAMLADVRAPEALDCKSSSCAAAASDQLANAAASSMVADALVGQVLERRVPTLTGQ